MKTPVSTMETAGEGGAWGMAILAMYAVNGGGMSLEDYLDEKVFAGMKAETESPDPRDVAGFDSYMQNYKQMLKAEESAVKNY